MRKGTAPAAVSNSETILSSETIWRTAPIVAIESAARCCSQNQSYRAASAPSAQTARPAMKKGLERKSWVSEKASVHVPSHAYAGCSVGLSASSRDASERASTFCASVALSPRPQPAASRSSAYASRVRSAAALSAAALSAAASAAATGGGAAGAGASGGARGRCGRRLRAESAGFQSDGEDALLDVGRATLLLDVGGRVR